MFRKCTSRTYYAAAVILLSLSLCMSACRGRTEEELNPSDPAGDINVGSKIVLVTDSTEWAVYLFKEHLLYSDAVTVALPSPWHIPTRDEATVLRTLTYASPSGERFITSDGYTFGMPSASVSKAGSKTKYSVLGLHIRKTVITIEF